MITDRQVQKAIPEAPASGKKSIELKDPGERGAGRLALIVRALANGVVAEWYAVECPCHGIPPDGLGC
jgi:hypothetical protein